VSPYWIVFAFCIVQGVALNSQFRPEREIRLPTMALWLPLVLVLAVFAGIRAPSSSADYQNYISWIGDLSDGSGGGLANRDPVFGFLGEALQSRTGGLVLFMFVIAVLSLLLKVQILEKREYKGLIGFGLILMIGRFFLLHEFTQVRAALGISLGTLALVLAQEGRWLRSGALFAVAALTHISVLGLLPLLAVVVNLRPGARWLKVAVTVLAAGVVAVIVAELNVISDIMERLTPYLSGQYHVATNTLLSTYFITKLVFLGIMTFQWRDLNSGLRLALLASLYGSVLTVVFLRNDVLSLRLSELVSIFDCICFAHVFRAWATRERVLATLTAMIIAGIFYYSATKIVHPYAIAI
jgi:hypothetical protein